MIYLVIALVLMCIASVVQLIIILKLREEKDANLKEIRDLYDRLRVNTLFTPQVTYMKTVPFTFQQTIPECEFNLMKSEGYYIDVACKALADFLKQNEDLFEFYCEEQDYLHVVRYEIKLELLRKDT